MSLGQIHEALSNTFAEPNYLLMREVRDATGFDAVRSADAIAIGLYRSCGRLIHGFECKVSRTDWLKELKDASKAESLMRYCHRWALIVPDKSIVHDGELPPLWGLGVPARKRANALLKIEWVVPPPELTPLPFSMVFITALLAAAHKPDKRKQEEAVRKAHEEGYQRGIASKTGGSAEEYLKLREAVREFQRTSGVHISGYTSATDAAKIGREFREWRRASGSVDGFVRDMQRVHSGGEYALKRLAEQIEELQRPSVAQPTFEEPMAGVDAAPERDEVLA